MDNKNFEQHILRLDAQIQALKHQQTISNEVICRLIYRIQVLESGQTNIADRDFIQVQNLLAALKSIRPLKQRVDA